MKRFTWIFLVVLIFGLLGCKKQTATEDTRINTIENELLASDFIDWYGRYAIIEDKAYFYHTATGFRIQFYGRIIEIELHLEEKKNDIYYSIAKNGEDLLLADVYVQTNSVTKWVIEFDAFQEHTLEIIKRSEPEDGITSLKHVTTNGYFLETTPKSQPHFLIFGASGISGHGALGEENQKRTTLNSSPLHSFGYLTAKAFDGSFEFVASSGWGLLFGYNDLTGVENIRKAYDYVGILPNRKVVDILYESKKTPDYVIVNLGGNDYTSVINTLSGFERTNKILEFKEAVAEFILKLRADAPNAYIIWTMTAGSQNGNAALEVINQLDELDKGFVRMVTIKQVGEDNDPIGANNHASFITHQKSAQNIINLIRSLTSEY